MNGKKGLIFNIQRYALHDGPGIRTTVFFKGCPLKCKWCHNPESINAKQEITYNETRCIKCDTCEDLKYPEKCPTGALENVGEYYSVDELYEEINKDRIFFDKSGGGVTFSGGEPLLQCDFLLEILKKCKSEGIHTAVDTTGYASWENLKKIKEYIDVFLYDIKILDTDKHKKNTGINNDIILGNFKKLAETNIIYVRVPIIKDFNDDDNNINKLCNLAIDNFISKIYFLPYHRYSENKYKNLLVDIKFSDFDKPSDERMKEIVKICESKGLEAYIGG